MNGRKRVGPRSIGRSGMAGNLHLGAVRDTILDAVRGEVDFVKD